MSELTAARTFLENAKVSQRKPADRLDDLCKAVEKIIKHLETATEQPSQQQPR